MNTDEIKHIWLSIRNDIELRLAEFKYVGKTAGDKELFKELAFCLFTPQSKARSCDLAVNMLYTNCLLFKGSKEQIAAKINYVRFRNNKAGYVIEARNLFRKNGIWKLRAILDNFDTPHQAREWLVKNIKGIGCKEAGHFLRNIGRSGNLAILDRHILKNLMACGVIKDMPLSLSKKSYMDIEKKMIAFSSKIGIPMDHLDLIFWYNEAGEIFK